MDKTRMPKIAGILTVISGALAVIGAVPIWWLIRGVVGFGTSGAIEIPIVLIALPLLTMGVVAIIGGVASIRRRNWGLALGGAICAVIFFLGIPAIVLLALSKKEFA